MKTQGTSSGKAQGAVLKYFNSLPPDMGWNNVKAVLQQQFSLVPMVTHVATHFMHRYQQKRDMIQNSTLNSVNFSKQPQIVN